VLENLAITGPLESATPMMVWVIVLSFVFAECAFIIGLFLPGDSLLLAAGIVLAVHDNPVLVWSLAVCTSVVAILGNHTGYVIGHKTGTRVLARKDGKVLNRRNLERAGVFFEHWGFWAVAVARWIPWIRTFAPMLAGAARMDKRKFFIASSLGAIGWAPVLMFIGYYAAGLLEANPWLNTLATVLAVTMFVCGTGYGLYRYRIEMKKPIDEHPTLLEAIHE